MPTPEIVPYDELVARIAKLRIDAKAARYRIAELEKRIATQHYENLELYYDKELLMEQVDALEYRLRKLPL